MQPEDEKRNEREADIAKSVQGPDFSAMKEALRRVHGELGKADSAAMRAYVADKIGYYLNYDGPLENGRIPDYDRSGETPGSKLEKADTDWSR